MAFWKIKESTKCEQLVLNKRHFHVLRRIEEPEEGTEWSA